MSRRLLILIGVPALVAALACGFLAAALFLHSAIPALYRWEAPYGVEGREAPPETTTVDGVLPAALGKYHLSEVVVPSPPLRLDIPPLSAQGNYSDGTEVVHLIVIKMNNPKEGQGLVIRVEQAVLEAGVTRLEGYWWPIQEWPRGGWKLSRLAWDRWYVRFYVPSWPEQAYGVAWNNGPWFFMVTSASLDGTRDLVTSFYY